MRIIDRYLISEIVLAVAWAVAVLTVILVLGNVLRELLPLLMQHQMPISYILSYIGYLLPFSLTYSIPWGVLVSVLLVFGKLSSENELLALRASGVSVLRICSPVFLLSVTFCGLCLWTNLYLAPQAQVKLKKAPFELATHNPLAFFGDDEVIDQFPNRKIYVGKKNGSDLEDLYIFEMNPEYVSARVIYAHRGTLEVDREHDQILLHIFNARYEERDPDALQDLKLMRYGITMNEGVIPIPLDELISKASKNQRPNQLTLQQLREALHSQTEEKDVSMLKTEVSKRFSNALAVLTFTLIGIPLAVTAQRKETSVGIAMSLVVAISYFIFIVLCDNFRSRPHLHPEILIWVPNLIYVILGSTLFVRLAKR
jgi:LPS export ABC transporter permease LptF